MAHPQRASAGRRAGRLVPARQARARGTGFTGTVARHHHSVYVVELARTVTLEPKFKRANPGYVEGRPCVYVGMTGLSPDVRFDKHKAGIQSNRFVKEYGLRLRPDLYACYNPMPYAAAAEMEVELGIALREQGFGVWQG